MSLLDPLPLKELLKQSWLQFLFIVKVFASKQQMLKLYLQIQRTDTDACYLVSWLPVVNLCLNFQIKL